MKLASQVERVEDLEPLPDLDFNIKCGNLLVGIADYDDATERLFSQRLDHVTQLQQVEETAKQIAGAFDDYIAAEAADTGQLDHRDAKQKLHAKLQAGRNLADTLLHDMRDEADDFEAWRASHQPFHWFVEFPSVWRNGGFDVVIGNPPYIKTKLVMDYSWVGYKTGNCPDLYAVCVERATSLMNGNGRFAMIVMHSICFSSKYGSLRAWLESTLKLIWISSYWSGRMGLFTGANPRNSIVVASKQTRALFPPHRTRTTRLNRWQGDARSTLFDSIEYAKPAARMLNEPQAAWPFLDPAICHAFETTVGARPRILDALVRQSEHVLSYKTTALYQLGVSVNPPPTIDPLNGKNVAVGSDSLKELRFRSAVARDIALVMLAGRWGYLWWLTYSDEFHVTRGTLAAFPGDIEGLSNRASGDMELEMLVELSRTLQKEMPKHLAWMTKVGLQVGRYNMMKLRYITDRADWLLAKAWGIEDAFEAAGNLRDRMILGNKR